MTAARTDKRIRLMNEIVNGVKAIKMFTWEQSFTKMAEEARKAEIDVIRHTSYYRAFNFSFFFTASRFILLSTFLVFGFTGQILTAEKAFICLSLYNTVRLSMTLFFPFAISSFGEAKVSVSRIRDFLLMEERATGKTSRSIHASDSKVSVEISGVSGKWKIDETENTLSEIYFKIRPGQLVAVIGPVGSGKSSLLQAILGELPILCGGIDIHGDISFSPQEPWVFSGSVEDNILFGKPYNKSRYLSVIKACALEHDLAQWSHGDKTLVGEKGVALSGGQKARVTLARAVYRNADCYLLDDPLSAVDAHVGKHLFQKCIRGFLKDSAIILVTHQLQYLKDADLIVVLKQGKIQETGTFQHLAKNGLDFSAFLTLEEEEKKEEEEDIFSEEDILLLKGREPVRKQSTFSDQFTIDSRNKFEQEKPDIKGFCRPNTLIRARTLSVGSDISQISNLREEIDSLTRDYEEARKPVAIKEDKSVGTVKGGLYIAYFKSGGNCCTVIFILFVNLLCQGLYSGSDIWISYWTSIEEKELLIELEELPAPILSNITFPRINVSVNYEEEWANPNNYNSHYFNLGIYAALVGALVIASMIRTVHFFVVCMQASVNLHNSMFTKVVQAQCRFFDVNPVGRILNRFSKDVGSMDELLPPAFFDAFTIFLNILGIMAVIFAVRPWVILPTLLLGIIFILLRRFYMRSARDIKRIEGIARSPVFSHLSTSLNGLTSIRAFNAEEMLRTEFDRLQDIHTSAWFAFISGTRWFGVWLDWIVVIYLACVVFSFLVLGGDLVGGDVGLAISSCITLTGMLQWGVRQSAEVENLMTSVERIMEYSRLEQEAPATINETKPPESWPCRGVIEFKDVKLRYAETEPMVLKGIDFKTHSAEKIGIVGRTGAGKSSIITALFRLAEPTGSIYIDGVDVLKIGLKDLRSTISIIPQDPLLFTGSLRRNLDPFNEFSDDMIWKVLKEVHMFEPVSELKHGIETEMSEGGTNFSLGQRQLVCLARASLRHNPVLVLDEATANVDPRTDKFIQEQIRTRFRDCTVLTIAHRLNTIMDSDRILVLGDGKIVEFDTPYNLLCKEDGVLAELAEQTGNENLRKLKEIAAISNMKDHSDIRED
ncbi:multidrug resistance-associated protein 4 [Eurytemora carolleeae]|uniref:multidrug resistance-associated protein 4 n=1 Tax=Eurytemora carolleeae TaxID=1294199 RepID=UPI000C783C28|nr:multidrug resistance-associated protein 4 [Eurytemora carolleeae]|eukprot:XP_023331666.1 multidrug resistance-associated protein 4-like [Eurytemora affinis]